MAKELTIKQKKELAKVLFTRNQFSQKEIAERVGISEKTMSKWVNDEDWEKLRKSLLTSKEEQLRMMYDQLNTLNVYITEQTETGIPDNRQADTIIKLTTAIKNLETETNVGQSIEVGMAFVRFVQRDDTDFAKRVTDYFDAFVKERLKQFHG